MKEGRSLMKILWVYPKYPKNAFWSFWYTMKFISKKAAFPPLGALTVAAMLPKKWEQKLVDMNVSDLQDEDLKWADYVFISAMITQKESAKEVIKRCNQLGKKVVAGGPVFTTGHEEFNGVDHFVLGEAENTLPQFLEDLQNGCAKPIYTSNERPNVTKTQIPLWSLINRKNYASMSIQYSRGCPYDCEFCDIVVMNGHKPRLKSAKQIIKEFEAVYQTGFRGSLFVVDDNFIGNKIEVKKVLPEIINWQKEHRYPFRILTEASLNIADDEELMNMMTEAGFDRVFIGLETPNEASLVECNKTLNENRDMVALIKKILQHGLQVMGGYIVGFDNDPPTIFRDQINFIQISGVVVAMIGMLCALPGTKLYNRLYKEKRLLTTASGNNTDAGINFIPKMDVKTLTEGYLEIIETIYSPERYYERIITFLENYQPSRKRSRTSFTDPGTLFNSIRSLLLSIWYLGVKGQKEERKYYWKLITVGLLKYHQFFSEAVVFSIYGHHFRRVAEATIQNTG